MLEDLSIFVPHVFESIFLKLKLINLNHIHPNYESGIIVSDIANHFGIYYLIYGTPPTQNKIAYQQIRQLNISNIKKIRNLLARADYS